MSHSLDEEFNGSSMTTSLIRERRAHKLRVLRVDLKWVCTIAEQFRWAEWENIFIKASQLKINFTRKYFLVV